MPRALLFAPCERVIFGAGDQSASLIIILQELQVFDKVPSNALTFSRFSVFSQWYDPLPDKEKVFEQRVALAYMDESPILENVMAFQMTTRLHRTVVNFAKFPAVKSGEHNLTLSVRPQGETHWPPPISTYPMYVTIPSQAQPITN